MTLTAPEALDQARDLNGVDFYSLPNASQKVRRLLFDNLQGCSLAFLTGEAKTNQALIDSVVRNLRKIGFLITVNDGLYTLTNPEHRPTAKQFAAAKQAKKAASKKPVKAKPVKPVTEPEPKQFQPPALGETLTVYMLHQDPDGNITLGLRGATHSYMVEIAAVAGV